MSALFCWPQLGRIIMVASRERENTDDDETKPPKPFFVFVVGRVRVCDVDDSDSLIKDDLMMMKMMMMIPLFLSLKKGGEMCSHDALFLCARNTAQKKDEERENTTIVVQKEESSSSSQNDDAVQERTRTGRPRRENSCALPFQFPIPKSSSERGRKALLLLS